jgi:hypothetical protein
VTTHEHAFVLAAPNHVTRVPPQRSPDHGKTPAHARKNGAARRDWSRQLPGTPRPPSTRAATPTPPTTPHGRVPALIIRMRLRAGAAVPGRLSTHPLCSPIAGHRGSGEVHNRPQRRTRLPLAAPTVKRPAQGRIPVESHLRSPPEPPFVPDPYPMYPCPLASRNPRRNRLDQAMQQDRRVDRNRADGK